ncbi:MAG TPA: protein kinase [Blastocatellia bacterium]|nr:protein kinase [Blastocatellia bacterium]
MREWLLSGTVIAGYRITSRLSANGLGEVYLAKDADADREVALKILPVSLVKDPKSRQRFLKIFAAISKLRHRNICEIYAGGITENGRPYVAMEYLKGQSLDQIRIEDPLSVDESLATAIQVADALEAASARGWLHLDVKPANLIVTPSRVVKILDYGQALAFPQVVTCEGDHLLKLTLGSARYLSPEQLAGERPDQRSDVFSLAAMLYEMIGGSHPFAAPSLDQFIASVMLAEPRPLTGLRPEMAGDLNRVLDRALAKEREARHQTAGELARELRGIAFRQPTVVPLAVPLSHSPTDMPIIDIVSMPVTAGAGTSPAAVKGLGTRAKWIKVDLSALVERSRQVWSRMIEALTRGQQSRVKEVRAADHRQSGAGLSRLIKNHRLKILAGSLVVFGMLLAIFVTGRYMSRERTPEMPPALQLTRLTSSGKVAEAVISPRGDLLAYVIDEGGQQLLYVRDLESTKEIRLASDSGREFRRLTFSMDGRWIHYIKTGVDETFGSLYRRSVDGGDEENLGDDHDIGSVSFSPDGKRIAYIVANHDRTETSLNVSDLRGEGITVARRQSPATFHTGGLAWSPDSRIVAAVVRDLDSGMYLKIVIFDLESGSQSTITSGRWYEIDRVAWQGDGKGLVVSAREPTLRTSQLWRVAYPSGMVNRITRDANDYRGASLTGDATRLVSVQSTERANIWVLSSDDFSQARQVTTDGVDGIDGLTWTPDGRLVYVSSQSGRETIWISDSNLNQPQVLPIAPEGGDGREYQPVVSPDGSYIVYVVERANGGSYLWRSDLDRRSLKRLTDENLVFSPSFSADSKSVVYSVLRDGRRVVAKSTIEGGPPVTLVEKQSWRPVVSPDGTRIACNYWDEKNARWKIAVFPSGGGPPLMVFEAPGNFQRVLRWTPNSNGLAFIVTRGTISNIWNQPLAGGAPSPLTDYKAGCLFDFAWSHDGQQLAVAQGMVNSDVVLIKNFK